MKTPPLRRKSVPLPWTKLARSREARHWLAEKQKAQRQFDVHLQAFRADFGAALQRVLLDPAGFAPPRLH